MEVYFDYLAFGWVSEFGSMLSGHYKQAMKLEHTEEEYFGYILAWVGKI